MRQKDYGIGQALHRARGHRRLLQLAVLSDVDDELLLSLSRRHRQAQTDVRLLQIRSTMISSTSFNINSLSVERCLSLFRFRPVEISKVCQLSNWTTGKTARSRYIVPPFTATCIMLRRLASPTRWVDMEEMFGMRSSALSEVFWEVVRSLVGCQGHILDTFRSSLMATSAARYASAVAAKGAPLQNCVGFIDCTKVQMCRPGGPASLQRSCYSGHKRFHCLIYQSVTTPDGLMFYLYGPEVGRRHDMTLYRESGLDVVLQQALVVNGQQYCLYGDAAYILRPWLQTAFPRVGASAQEAAYNTAMSSVREAVEWTFKDLKQQWSSQDYKRMLKVRQSPIALLYKTAGLLWNFRQCMTGGGQVATYFDCAPPSLAQYVES